MLLSLTVICIVAGALLAGVNLLTEEPIALARKIKLENAIKEVTPEFDNSPSTEFTKVALPSGDSLTIYPAIKNGVPVGAAVESFSMNGFSGEIRILVGFDADGKIINYEILKHAETPGLGSKMKEWFKTEKNQQSILGKSLAGGGLRVSKDGGEVDAITASTITSRAFLEAVNQAYSAYTGTDATTGATMPDGETGATDQQTDGESGATEQVEEEITITEEGGKR